MTPKPDSMMNRATLCNTSSVRFFCLAPYFSVTFFLLRTSLRLNLLVLSTYFSLAFRILPISNTVVLPRLSCAVMFSSFRSSPTQPDGSATGLTILEYDMYRRRCNTDAACLHAIDSLKHMPLQRDVDVFSKTQGYANHSAVVAVSDAVELTVKLQHVFFHVWKFCVGVLL